MKITYLGHAGLFIETAKGSILCDPWFNPAFLGSWFPFPRNDGVDTRLIEKPDFLYISHEHRDHLDRRFLIDRIDKSVKVLLPDYPIQTLERELRDIGFTSFVRTTNGEAQDVGNGLRVAIVALIAPSDGPEGDSGLVVDDGNVRLFNQNDSRPSDMEALQKLGPFDAHFLQFSGAIWYPMVYRLGRNIKAELGRRKRLNQQKRALDFVKQVDARFVFPSAGPPCFLDDDLYQLNDFAHDPSNIFCDQSVFLQFMRDNGDNRGQMIIPGSVIALRDKQKCEIDHPLSSDEIRQIFLDKRGYLDEYRQQMAPVVEKERASWPAGNADLVASMRARIEPLLSIADLTCAGVNDRVLFVTGATGIVIDFLMRRVYEWDGEECRYRFWVDPRLLEHCVLYENDWVNSLFLSCRFEAERDGPYNEYVYNFFKCLSVERLQYAEGYYAEESGTDELVRIGEYMVQRRCPHLKADLARFGRLENGVLTCSMHGWQFDIASGRCLTADDRRLYTRHVGPEHDDSGA